LLGRYGRIPLSPPLYIYFSHLSTMVTIFRLMCVDYSPCFCCFFFVSVGFCPIPLIRCWFLGLFPFADIVPLVSRVITVGVAGVLVFAFIPWFCPAVVLMWCVFAFLGHVLFSLCLY